ncbi:MAG: FMN-binding protein [Spirochaetaceae bacterium]|nr:MAG: FMN-binding protein [Spirochaetaceae bacterium]
MKDNTRTLAFAGILGLICALVLAGVSQFTAPYRQANERAEEVRNYLSALGVPGWEGVSSQELLDVFERNVRVEQEGEQTVYQYLPVSGSQVQPVAIAVPFSGTGLWGPIRGVLALEPDFTTIRGIRFFDQQETPGLGGEIGAEWFQNQFVGKRIVSAEGDPGFRITKPGGSEDANSVDGITGATMTSDRVEVILDNLAKELLKEK